MQTDAAVDAIRKRAKHLMLVQAWLNKPDGFAHGKGQLNALDCLTSGRAQTIAASDESRGGYQPCALFERCWPALPIGFERLTIVDIQQFLTAQGVQPPTDNLPHSQINAVEQFKHDEFAALQGDDKHHAMGSDVSDGAGQHAESISCKSAS